MDPVILPEHDPDQRPQHPAGSINLTRKRRPFFIVAALAAPFILLALIEGCLRLLGIGGYPPTILKVGPVSRETLVTTNVPGAGSYFQRSQRRGGAITEQSFLSPKPAGTIRIFLAGGSAIKGFPQPPAFASSAFLEAMLADVWPDRRIEVINLGTTAVASFPAMEMLAEALEYQPDLAVIYSGHNEFFGAYGVASTHSAGRRPIALRFQRWLRRLGLVQLLERLRSPVEGGEQKTLMELVVARGHIPPDDPLRQAAARNLHAHVSRAVRQYRRNGVPVIVCTLPSNERDLAPIGGDDLSGLSAADRTRVTDLVSEGRQKLATDAEAAREKLQTAVGLAPRHARAHFLLGRALFALGQHAEAGEHFRAALDLDSMPWRATSSLNDALRRAAAEQGALLCDAQAFFRAASPGGCIGWELMDDHVHLSLEGQAQLARAIIESMTRLEGQCRVAPEAVQALAPWAVYAKRLGDNLYDRYAVAHSMRVIFDIPFMRASNPEAFERFDALCRQYEAGMSPAVLEQVRQWQRPPTHTGLQRPITAMVGTAMIAEKRFAEAEKLFRVAQRCVPQYSSWNCEYVYRMLACRLALAGSLTDSERELAAQAVQRGEYILTRSPEHPGLTHRWVGRLEQLRGRFKESIPHLRAARQTLWGMELVATDAALIDAYLTTGDPASARELIEQGIRDGGQYAAYYRQFLASFPPGAGGESQP